MAYKLQTVLNNKKQPVEQICRFVAQVLVAHSCSSDNNSSRIQTDKRVAMLCKLHLRSLRGLKPSQTFWTVWVMGMGSQATRQTLSIAAWVARKRCVASTKYRTTSRIAQSMSMAANVHKLVSRNTTCKLIHFYTFGTSKSNPVLYRNRQVIEACANEESGESLRSTESFLWQNHPREFSINFSSNPVQ